MWSDNLLHKIAIMESDVKRTDEIVPSNIEAQPIEITKKTSIVFVLIPSWSIRGPPYNLARLSALAEVNGYKTTSIDMNIVAKIIININVIVVNFESNPIFDSSSSSKDFDVV